MPELVGIARLAAESPLLEAKQHVEYFHLPARSFLSRCDNPRLPFSWTINPYRGCEFGCKYCYARYAHEFMELRDPSDFERKIFAKQFDEAGFREELRRIPGGESIALGTATERHTQTNNTITDLLGQIEGVPTEQVGAEILAMQTRLQASLQTTAMLYKLSLVNYV